MMVEERRALIIVVHGSPVQQARRWYESLENVVKEKSRFWAISPITVRVIALSHMQQLDVNNAVVVPCFLTAGFHVDVDIPSVLSESCSMTAAVGPDPIFVESMCSEFHKKYSKQYLEDLKERRDPKIVLVAAGTENPRAQDEIARVAHDCANFLKTEVSWAFIIGKPSCDDFLAQTEHIFFLNYLLHEGIFYKKLSQFNKPTTSILNNVHLLCHIIEKRWSVNVHVK